MKSGIKYQTDAHLIRRLPLLNAADARPIILPGQLMSMSQPSQSSEGVMQSSFDRLTLDSTLDDLCARFIVNLPAEELESMDRICFQIEQAHWYYEDFVRPTAANPSLLPSFGLKAFSLLMFKSCPLLHDLIPNHAQIWTSFMAYKERVPVCGAILVSENWNKALLVKGWQKGSTWSFPRGKINKNETQAACAVREVYEETGYDASWAFPVEQLQPGYVDREGRRDPHYVEVVIREQKLRLYFIPNVPEDTVFETRTRKEISKIQWFRLSDLPTWKRKKKQAGPDESGQGPKQPKYYMVTPFISHLRSWVEQNRPRTAALISREQTETADKTREEINLEAGQRQAAGSGHPLFATAEEGTAALNAFFFGEAGAVKAQGPASQSTPSHYSGTFNLAQLEAELVETSSTPRQNLLQQTDEGTAIASAPEPSRPATSDQYLAASSTSRPVGSPFSPKQEASTLLDILNSNPQSTIAPVDGSLSNGHHQIHLQEARGNAPRQVLTIDELELQAKQQALLKALSEVAQATPTLMQKHATSLIEPTPAKDEMSAKKQALLSIFNAEPFSAARYNMKAQMSGGLAPPSFERGDNGRAKEQTPIMGPLRDVLSQSQKQTTPQGFRSGTSAGQYSHTRVSPPSAVNGDVLLHHVMSRSPPSNPNVPPKSTPNSATLLDLLNATNQ
ncbi:mRNA-decapping enzyme subunit 2 [Microbotryomycetes sp. JL201]|nr:mRNA-decapping enzyme subunit 2 [Microbotryomycetes sp. JL201]